MQWHYLGIVVPLGNQFLQCIQCFVQKNEDTIVQFSASVRTIPLLSGGKVYPNICRESLPGGGLKLSDPCR